MGPLAKSSLADITTADITTVQEIESVRVLNDADIKILSPADVKALPQAAEAEGKNISNINFASASMP